MPEEERLRELFMEYLDLDESLLLPEMSLDELAVDSLTLLELLTAVENEFDLELDDEAFGACRDLGEMSEMILAKIRG